MRNIRQNPAAQPASAQGAFGLPDPSLRTGGLAVNNIIQYKGSAIHADFLDSDPVLYGKVPGYCSLISCEGSAVQKPVEDFHGAVEDGPAFS